MKKKESGFSLFELMVVIAIIAILSAMVVPNFIAWKNNANLKGAAFNLKSDLEMAKMRAIRGGRNVAVLFTDTGYEIFEDANSSFTKESTDTVVATRSLNNLIIVRTFNGDPSPEVTGFNNRGLIAESAGTAKTGSVQLALPNYKKSVTIEVTRVGRINMRWEGV